MLYCCKTKNNKMEKTMFEKITPVRQHVENMKRDEWIRHDYIGEIPMELLLMYVNGIVLMISDPYEFDKNGFLNTTIIQQIFERKKELNKWNSGKYNCDDDVFVEAMKHLNESQIGLLEMVKKINKTLMS